MTAGAEKKKTLSLRDSKKPALGDKGGSARVLRGDSRPQQQQVGKMVEVVRKRTPTHRPAQQARPNADGSLTDIERKRREEAIRGKGEAPESEQSQPEAQPKPEISKEDDQQARRDRERQELERTEREEEDRRKQTNRRHAERQSKTRADAPEPQPQPQPHAMPEERSERSDRHGARPSSKRREAPETPPKRSGLRRGEIGERRSGKITITEALDGGENMRQRSLASVRRAREREKARMRSVEPKPKVKQVREVIIPDVITVQELSNRMAERAVDVIKELMKVGVMATVTETLDAETAELIVLELGHKPNRVSEADVDIIGDGDSEEQQDDPKNLEPRPPVVTVMGHVDHGKTSLLDAIRASNIVSAESGGITQHIGAYQVKNSANVITFIDTPGHEAFTEMRVRGAHITDIVVLVVAADDGVMQQTIEAINHAKAAECPLIIAINKCDKPEADPNRVRSDLLSHGVVTETQGGDVLAVEVSAHTKAGLDKLEEAILLQAEVMELKANPEGEARGVVIEAKVDRGRGSVAALLVTQGELMVGDVFIVGAEMGKVRALYDAEGRSVKSARPGDPVEVLGLSGTPLAGDRLMVVESEARAREVSEYRQRMQRRKAISREDRGSVEQMLSAIAENPAEELPLVIKTDVHGSLEAIRTAIEKLATDQVKVRVLSSGVGAVSESDISLAAASMGMVIGFNVRANPQARDQAKRDGIVIRYHSIIYELIDEIKAAMSGLLSPDHKEEFIGYAEIREVFNISSAGKIGGCYVTEGVIKKGCSVRLLRDNIVIHEGSLKTLKRFKDEVKEVREGQECGMAFESYEDIKEGDIVECFEVIEIARKID